jgi:hypothetical protein
MAGFPLGCAPLRLPQFPAAPAASQSTNSPAQQAPWPTPVLEEVDFDPSHLCQLMVQPSKLPQHPLGH